MGSQGGAQVAAPIAHRPRLIFIAVLGLLVTALLAVSARWAGGSGVGSYGLGRRRAVVRRAR